MHTKNAYFQQVTTQGNILHIDTNPLGISYPGANAFDPINENPFLPHHLNHDKKYSPPVSPSGYSSCNSSSGHGSPRKDIPHNKCHLIRRNTKSIASPPVSAQSWDHIKSPAASFLASFASPPPSSLPSSLGAAAGNDEEQDGDELDDYVLENVIGHGGFSRVRSGYCISDGRKVAVKVTSQERELAIWKQLDHPHVLSMEKLLETESGMCYAVCTYCGGGTLLDLVKEKQHLEEAEARCIVRQLTSALVYLHHDARVVHKDLKLDNVLLLDDKKTIKLGDFGLAVFQQPTTSTHEEDDGITQEYAGGSLAYTAPEQIRTPWVITSPSTDMWSLGVILYALVAGRLPFDDTYDARLQQKILSGDFEMPPTISPPLASLIAGLLHVDPQQRLTARQVLDSAWCNMTA
ncbi:maternal embryonic leucine zipper kinase-like [Lichtheimia corymbifera JMRC:FSU:9682]|uniref:Maternal embryonic leucine zipper kinase-like n=1 Tax=Lichtheimia corymbifera JMRC:FSU:9682 TaxID=1263082 RepID=A0A068SDI3_9FUNG|nr:maternal embryonic leucine zipper kinase-like [Lichtheimia corymbifera JMRC:FSU:9682]